MRLARAIEECYQVGNLRLANRLETWFRLDVATGAKTSRVKMRMGRQYQEHPQINDVVANLMFLRRSADAYLSGLDDYFRAGMPTRGSGLPRLQRRIAGAIRQARSVGSQPELFKLCRLYLRILLSTQRMRPAWRLAMGDTIEDLLTASTRPAKGMQRLVCKMLVEFSDAFGSCEYTPHFEDTQWNESARLLGLTSGGLRHAIALARPLLGHR
jgi:hypothetical protein